MSQDLNNIIEEKNRSNLMKALLIGIAVITLWTLFDMTQTNWKLYGWKISIARSFVIVAWTIVYILLKRNIIKATPAAYIVAIAFIGFSVVVFSLTSQNLLYDFFISYSMMGLIYGLFLLIETKHLIIIIVLGLIMLIATNLILNIYSWKTFLQSGFLSAITLQVFAIILNNIRIKLEKNNIISKLKLESAYNEIRQINEELKRLNEQLEDKNQQITNSIKYAYYIQSFLLSKRKDLNEYLDKFALLYLPRDILSGDFFWIRKKKNTIYLAVADATGHGIPAAMVSIYCNNALNQAFNNLNNPSPADILNFAKKYIKQAFSSPEEKLNEGMDISLIKITKNKLIFAGANNPIIIINKNGQLTEIKGDKIPIGNFPVEKEFSNKEFTLNKGDRIALFSDGFIDQINGNSQKRLGKKRFKELLTQLNNININKVEHELKNFLQKWKNNEPQTDDITVLIIEM